jgi:hypothetical protein
MTSFRQFDLSFNDRHVREPSSGAILIGIFCRPLAGLSLAGEEVEVSSKTNAIWQNRDTALRIWNQQVSLILQRLSQ